MWTVEIDSYAEKALNKLDKPIQIKIRHYLENLERMDNPRQLGKALRGNLKGAWRYRVGNYRILCNIQDDKIIILVVDVAHRKNVYKK